MMVDEEVGKIKWSTLTNALINGNNVETCLLVKKN